MPTLLVGKIESFRRSHECERGTQECVRHRASGVTLIEMVVVVGLISLMVGVSYPAITSGIDSLRLNAATNGVVSFRDYGLSRAERRQQMVEITILKGQSAIEMRSSERGFFRRLQMPDGVSIVRVFPALPESADPDAVRNFFLYPGGTVPPLGLQLINRRKVQRVVRVDPITGVPHIEAVPE